MRPSKSVHTNNEKPVKKLELAEKSKTKCLFIKKAYRNNSVQENLKCKMSIISL